MRLSALQAGRGGSWTRSKKTTDGLGKQSQMAPNLQLDTF
jgi:hypothetical protein